eukprot:g80743.t1
MEMINTLACAPEQLKPSSVPCVDLVNKVWRMEFAHVKPIRDSDWAKDGICTLLAVECQQLKRHKENGFENQAAVEEYKRRSQLHHKIHRTNRTASVQRKAGAPGDQTCTTISTDMTPPFQFPACRRAATEFRGKFVISTYCDGSYGDNTGLATLAFLNWIIYKGWRWQNRLNRLVPHHGFSGDDQKFRTIKRGLRSTFLTTNLAQALVKVLASFKQNKNSFVLLVIKTNYDWDKFFKPCINRSITFYNRPLQWRFTASSQLGWLPTGEYKTWGDAQEHYNGAGDLPIKDGAAPIQFFVKMPGSDVPDKLPPVDFATTALKKDVRKLAKQFCSKQE